MPKAKKDEGKSRGNVGRPPMGAEPRVKRYFNFQESLDNKLGEETSRTKASNNAIVEVALKATIAPELLTDDDRDFLKKFAPVEVTKDSDLGHVVEQAVERVLETRFGNTQLTLPADGDAVVVELPERQRQAIESMAAMLGFGAASHLLRSMVIGALANPDSAENFLFAGQRGEAKARTQKQLQEEERGQGPQLKVA